MKKINWRIWPILFFISLCFFLWRGLSLNPREIPSVQIGKRLPEFNLPRLEQPGIFVNGSQLRNQVIVLNIWASWCNTCAEEQPFLMKLARTGVPILGINYKDQSQDALEWLGQWGNPYYLILEDKQGKMAIDLGAYGTPETFIIDKKGIIRYRHAGALDEALWQNTILPLIKKLEQNA